LRDYYKSGKLEVEGLQKMENQMDGLMFTMKMGL